MSELSDVPSNQNVESLLEALHRKKSGATNMRQNMNSSSSTCVKETSSASTSSQQVCFRLEPEW